jgi:holo-[acyl-carrier protein] synthase
MHDHQRSTNSLAHLNVPFPSQVVGVSNSPIQAIGIDLVEVGRLRALEQRWGEGVLARLFTEQERSICRKASGAGYRWQSLAGRFGAKEATKKVLAVRGITVRWQDVEVINGIYGEPLLRLYGYADEARMHLGYQRLLLSISHDAGLAIAIVIAV